MSPVAARAAAASVASARPEMATASTPKRAISSEPGIAASANIASGNPISRPTCVSLMCRSSWMSGMTGGTARSGIRIAAPASQSSGRMTNSEGEARTSPGGSKRFIAQDAWDPARSY